MCNVFNKYVCNIGDSLVNKLPQKDYSKADFQDYCKPSLLSSMVCDTVDQNELLNLIATLNNNKSPGPDNIGPRLIKRYSSQVTLHNY